MPRIRSIAGLMMAALAVWLALATAARADEPTAPQAIEFFESRIRPVLVERCYECHNSTNKAEGELTLDHRAGLLDGGTSGPAIVPGKPVESRLLKVIRHEIDGLEMPDGGPKLDERTVGDFEKWIAAGAADPRDQPPSAEELANSAGWPAVFERRKQWWSFRPIRRPAIPAVRNEHWSVHPVDRFVLAKLQENSLGPAAAADPATLVRRLHFALIGLPPTTDEAALWTSRLADADDARRTAAVSALVDHLLASPHFGERWARHWMDWIRFAESHGSEGDPPIEGAHQYRDYLIRALNADVPYDQLVREHMAGDLLESPRTNARLGINESAIGTAHWRMVFHGFAPTDALDEKVRFTDDQINAFTKAFLGLTVSCARCHDHKFDAISQADYYALFGILGSCRPGRAVVDLAEIRDRNRDRLAELKPRIRQALAADWLAAAPQVVERLLQDDGPWTKADDAKFVLHPWFVMRRDAKADSDFAPAWQRQHDEWQRDVEQREAFRRRSDVRRWNLAADDGYAAWYRYGNGLPEKPLPAGEFAVAPEGEAALTGIYPAGAYSHRLSTKHAARLTSADFRLDREYSLHLRVIGAGGSTVRYVVQNYPRNGTVYPVADLPADWRWQAFDVAYWSGDDVHIELAAARDAPLMAKRDMPRSWFGIREAVLVKKGETGPPADQREFLDPLFEACAALPGGRPRDLRQLADACARAIATAIEAWRDGRMSDAQALLLDACLREGLLANRLDDLPTAKSLVAEYRALEADVPEPTRVPSLDEWAPQNQRLLARGNHKTPGDEVPRRFLEAIDATPYDTASSGRRQLAEDLLRDDNPLARRVIVNRVWHHLFGKGLVQTPDNFGRLGEQPTHPELLDYLAARFAPLPGQNASRSEDDFGWSLKKLIRFLVTSNTWQLDSRPSEPALQIDPDNRLLSHAGVRRLEAEAIRDSLLSVSGSLDRTLFGESVGGETPRRSIYVRVERNALDPLLRVFDFPDPSSATGRRDATNVPAQSLTMMNDPRVDAYAAAWADGVLADAALRSDEQRIGRMFLASLGRPALPSEVASASAYLAALKARHEQLAHEAGELRDQVARRQSAVHGLLEPTRLRLMGEARSRAATASAPKPIARWEFDNDLRDSIGELHASAVGGAHVEDGALIVDGRQAYAVTPALSVPLQAKTLEAWVALDHLEQRGGGVMSVQTADGAVFDAIVFGEQAPGEWLAGSNNFARTQAFVGSPEAEAASRAVHLAIAYHAGGRIVGYRDGRPYGKAYPSAGPAEFPAGNTVVTFGVRHLPAVGNRMLAGRILRAQIYDRALSDDEILATSQVAGSIVTEPQVLAALTAEERRQVEMQKAEIATLESKLNALGLVPQTLAKQSLWKDLARAIFCFKEFIYVK